MKRKQLLKNIAMAAAEAGIDWALRREGANHSVYSLGGLTIPIPRHSEIDEQLARKIYKECEPELGERWW